MSANLSSSAAQSRIRFYRLLIVYYFRSRIELAPRPSHLSEAALLSRPAEAHP